MPKRRRKEPVEPPWRNGQSYPFGEEPPLRWKTVVDFDIALVPTQALGTVMEWRSLELGLLTPFVYYAHLEDPDVEFDDAGRQPRRFRDGWRPVGTTKRPYMEIDQGFVFSAWADERFVYVEYGDDEPEPTIWTWYRVPVDQFHAAWERMLHRLPAA